MPLLTRRRPVDDEVIDLTEVLAPYDGSTLVRPDEAETLLAPPLSPVAGRESLALDLAPEAAEPPVRDAVVDPITTADEAAPTVLEPAPAAAAAPPRKQPRNEPCACGSGQKFKRCCLELLATPRPQAALV